MTLNEIGLKHSTDKSSIAHHYLDLFDLLFSKWRNKRIHLLEVGVQFGNSLRTWREYGPTWDITGIDSVDNGVKDDGFTVIIGNAYDGAMLEFLNPPYDCLIEDGSHVPSDQAFFVSSYLPMLREGGIGIVEDVLSPDTLLRLEKTLPAGFQSTSVEPRKGANLPDSKLFIAWRI